MTILNGFPKEVTKSIQGIFLPDNLYVAMGMENGCLKA
jgi:hypothetical protein